MEQTKNFLDVLEERFGELVENGTITQEQLKEGIHIDKSWLCSSNIQQNDFMRAIMELIIENNHEYLENCKEFNTDPNEPFDLIISQRQNGLEFAVIGNDQWSKLIVSKEKNPLNNILQITPDELLEEIFSRTLGRIQWDITKKLPEEVKLTDIQRILKSVIDPKTIKALKDGQEAGLTEMADNLANYYKYLLELEQEQKPDQDPELGQDSEIIFAGYRDRVSSPGPIRQNGTGTTSPKKHDEIDFDKRDAMFSALNPLKTCIFHSPVKGAHTPILSDYVYIYPAPNGDGYLLINEPFSGNEITRTIYISEEALQDFLMHGQEKDDEFWKSVTKYFVDMGELEFRETKHTCNLYHLDEEGYLETLNKIITGKDEPKRLANDPVSRRVKKARAMLFGEKITAKEIKQVADSTSHELDAEMNITFAASLVSKLFNKQNETNKPNFSGPDGH